MTLKEFKIVFSDLILYFQLIENDLRLIYSLMHKGDICDNLNFMDKRNLGFVINKLKDLDNIQMGSLLFLIMIIVF